LLHRILKTTLLGRGGGFPPYMLYTGISCYDCMQAFHATIVYRHFMLRLYTGISCYDCIQAFHATIVYRHFMLWLHRHFMLRLYTGISCYDCIQAFHAMTTQAFHATIVYRHFMLDCIQAFHATIVYRHFMLRLTLSTSFAAWNTRPSGGQRRIAEDARNTPRQLICTESTNFTVCALNWLTQVRVRVRIHNDDTEEFHYMFCMGVKFDLAQCGNENRL